MNLERKSFAKPLVRARHFAFNRVDLFLDLDLPLVCHNTNLDMARGKLIVFEGLDRSGKSTQCERLVSYLSEKGVPVRHRRFPGI